MGVHKVADLPKGEDCLSSFERKLWDLTYACLIKYGCPVIFHVFGPYAQARINQTITFFVPRGNPHAQETMTYLRDELASETREPTIIPISGRDDGWTITNGDGEEIKEEWCFGTEVKIAEFDGPGFYIEQEHIAEMSKKYMASLGSRLKAS